jgi:hypothetical protein
MKALAVILFCSISLFSCTIQERATFPYKIVIGTTGNEKYISIHGKWMAIDFSDTSDKKAIQALLGLRWEIVNRNAEGKIFLTGQKLNTYRLDIDGRTKIYDFVLTNWHITTPFERDVVPDGWMPGDRLAIEMRRVLDGTSFRYGIDED